MTTKDRLLQWIKDKGYSVSGVTIKAGLNDGKIRKVDNISSDTLASILSVYPELSAEWLLTGRGSMEKETDTKEPTTHSNNEEIIEIYKERISELKERISELKETIQILREK